MNTRQWIQSLSVLLGWLAASVALAVATPNQEAFDLVQETTDSLLGNIESNRERYLEDTAFFFAEIDDLLSPVIDFKRISRRVMAKHFKKATPEQHQKFQEVFKYSLLKVYAKGLLEYNNEKITVLPPPKVKRPSNKKQRIDIELISAGGTKFPITYSMYKDKSGIWRMENVIVNGINIGLTYRNQFARLMKLNKNDIDLVIAGWTSEVNANSNASSNSAGDQ